MTINGNAPVNFTRVNTQTQQVSNLSQQSATATDTATFSEAAKQLAQEHVHSQSGASGTWSQPTATQNTQKNTQAPTTDLQSLLMKSILSAYGTSGSQNSGIMSLRA